jgi:hypothetical protein
VAINLKSAKALGFTIPSTLLALRQQVAAFQKGYRFGLLD